MTGRQLSLAARAFLDRPLGQGETAPAAAEKRKQARGNAICLAINKRSGRFNALPAHAQVREAHPGMPAVPCRHRGAGAACPALFLGYAEDSNGCRKGGTNMKPNMGTADKIIRLVVVAVIAVLYFTGQIAGVAAIILGIVAVAFLVTSLIGWCPTYVPFGISTRKTDKALR